MSANNKNVISSVTAILKTLECAICLELLKTPVSTGCGHFFCRFCITEVLKSNYRTPCPLCKRSFTRRSIQEAHQRQSVILAAKKLAEVCGKKAGINFFSKECLQKEVEKNCADPCFSNAKTETIAPQKNYKTSTSKKRKSNENEIDGDIIEDELPEIRYPEIESKSTEEIQSSSSAGKRCRVSQIDEDSDDELPSLEELFRAPCKADDTKKQVDAGQKEQDKEKALSIVRSGNFLNSKYEKSLSSISNDEEMDITTEKISELAKDKIPDDCTTQAIFNKKSENIPRNRRKTSVNAQRSKAKNTFSVKNRKNALRNKTNQLNNSEDLQGKEAILSKSLGNKDKPKNLNESAEELVKENKMADVYIFSSPVKETIKVSYLSDSVRNQTTTRTKKKSAKKNTKKKLLKLDNNVEKFDGQTSSSAEEESFITKIKDAENFQLTVSRTTIPSSISVSGACNEKECYSLSETEIANVADSENNGLKMASKPVEADNIADTAVSVQTVSSPEKQKTDFLSKSPGWSRVKQVGKDFRIRKFSKLHVAKNSSNSCSSDTVAVDSGSMPCNMAMDQPVLHLIQNKKNCESLEENGGPADVERNRESTAKTKEINVAEMHNSSPECTSESSKMIVEAIVHSKSSRPSDCKKSEILVERNDNTSEDQADHITCNEQATKASVPEVPDNMTVNSCPPEITPMEDEESPIPPIQIFSNEKPNSDFKTHNDETVLSNCHTPVSVGGSSIAVTEDEENIQSAVTPKSSLSKPHNSLSSENLNSHELQISSEMHKMQSGLTKETDSHVNQIPQQNVFNIGTNFENVNDGGIECMDTHNYGANNEMPKILYRENIFDQEHQANEPCYSNTVHEHISFTDSSVESEVEINQPVKKFKQSNASTEFPDLSKVSKLTPKFSKISRCQITATESILTPEENIYYAEHSQQTSQRLLNFCGTSRTHKTNMLPTDIHSDIPLYSAINLSSGLLKHHAMPRRSLWNKNQVEMANTEHFINAEKTKVVKRTCLTLEEIQESFSKSNSFGKTETICSLPFSSGEFKLHVCISEETLNISVLKVVEPDLAGVMQIKSNALLLSEKNIQTSRNNSPLPSPTTVLPSSNVNSESSQPDNHVSGSNISNSQNNFPYLNDICPSESAHQAYDVQESLLNESEVIPFMNPGTCLSPEQNLNECKDDCPSDVTDENPSKETSRNVSDWDSSDLPPTQPYQAVPKKNSFDHSDEKKVSPFERDSFENGVKSDSRLLGNEISPNSEELADKDNQTSNCKISSAVSVPAASNEENSPESVSSLPSGKSDKSSDILITQGNLKSGTSYAQIIDDSEGFSSDPDMAFANDLLAPLKDITKRMETSGNANNETCQRQENEASGFSDTTLRAKRSLQDFEELILKKSKDISAINASSQKTSRLSLKLKRNSKKFKRIKNCDSDDSDTSDSSKNETCMEKNSLRAEVTTKSTGSFNCKKNDIPGDSVQATLNSFYSEDITNGNSSEIAMEIEDLDKKILSVVEKLKQCGHEDLLQREAQIGPLNAPGTLSKESKSRDEISSSDSEDSTDIFSQSVPPTPPGAY